MRTLLTITLVFASCVATGGEWQQLPSLPDTEGFGGSFGGVSHGALLVAGGANFPDQKPWEGGKKVWYDNVFVLEKPHGKWRVAGKLPRPLGYGVSVSHDDGVVCVGGSDAVRHYADAFRLDWRGGKLVGAKLPSLPKPIANLSGALVGDVLYVAGGIEKPDSNDTLKLVWQIDLAATQPKWTEIEPCPGSSRMLAVTAGFDGAFWLAGGVDLAPGKDGQAERRYLRDAYRYDADKGWQRIADLPHSVVAAPLPAPADASGFYVIGGDDGAQAMVAPEKHRGFGRVALRYNAATNTWADVGEIVAPRATAPCVFWHGSWVVPGGEVRPGIRSTEVWSWSLGKAE
jgi:N-acetylneuraminate epimerase